MSADCIECGLNGFWLGASTVALVAYWVHKCVMKAVTGKW